MGNRSGNVVYALRYAERDARRQQHFYGAIDRPDDPMPISYFIWLIMTPGGPILVDTGFTAATASAFGRTYLSSPRDLVRAVGIDPDALQTVVLTHLHYDHAGSVGDFPQARVVLQRDELDFWTGPLGHTVGCELGMSHLVIDADVDTVVSAAAAGRVDWADEVQELSAGVTVHRVGGHTPGMQVVRVETAMGPVVIASDATHFYENLQRNRPFAVLDSVPGALAAFAALRDLTSEPDLIVPGHDPAVLDRFPPLDRPDLTGNAVVIG